jgi:hypothetical protein
MTVTEFWWRECKRKSNNLKSKWLEIRMRFETYTSRIEVIICTADLTYSVRSLALTICSSNNFNINHTPFSSSSHECNSIQPHFSKLLPIIITLKIRYIAHTRQNHQRTRFPCLHEYLSRRIEWPEMESLNSKHNKVHSKIASLI